MSRLAPESIGVGSIRVVGLSLLLVVALIVVPSVSLLLVVHADDPGKITTTYPLLSSAYPATSEGLLASSPLRAPNGDMWCEQAEDVPCVAIPAERVCLSRSVVEAAWPLRPSIAPSLSARFDLRIAIEAQAESASLVLAEMMRILLTEVAGYSVTIRQDANYRVQLPRCLAGKFDMHTNIWRTDWSDEEWAQATATDINPDACTPQGPSGLLGRDAWFADEHSVNISKAAGSSDPLEFWTSYTKTSVVAGLPQFNLTQANLDPAADWFVPPQCSDATTSGQCGVAYVFSMYWQPSTHMQQVVNLKLKVALYFPESPEIFWAMVQERLDTKQQVLFFYFEPDPFTASGNVRRVMLPDPTHVCYDGDGWENHWDGIGPVACDFRPETLSKLSRNNHDSDKQDAFDVFTQLHVAHEEMMNILNGVFAGQNIAEASCDWLQANTETWSSWFQEPTPRNHELKMNTAGANAIYALLALFAVVSIVCHAFLFIYREHVVIRRSSYIFNQLIVLGSLFYYVALVIGMQPDSVTTCVTSQFLLSAGFILFYGSLLVKTYRLCAIFYAKKMQAQRITDLRLGMYLLAYAAIDMGLVVIWSGVDTPTPKLVTSGSSPYAFVSTCGGNHTDVFAPLLYLVRGIALLTGAVYAIRIRDIDDNYNESTFIALCTYNILVVAAIVLGIRLIAVQDPATAVGTWMGGVSFAVFLSTVIFVGAKAWSVFFAARGKFGSQLSQMTHTMVPRKSQIDTGKTSSQDTTTCADLPSPARSSAVSPLATRLPQPRRSMINPVPAPESRSASGTPVLPPLLLNLNSTRGTPLTSAAVACASPSAISPIAPSSPAPIALSPVASPAVSPSSPRRPIAIHYDPALMKSMMEFMAHKEEFATFQLTRQAQAPANADSVELDDINLDAQV